MNRKAFRHPLCRNTLLAAAGVLLASGGCHRGPGESARELPPPPVGVVVVQPQRIPVALEFLGQAADTGRVDIKARVPGFIKEKLFRDGQDVEAGQPLYTIDPREYQANLDIARAQQEQAEAAQQLAQTDLARVRELVASNAAAPRDLDTAVAKERTTRASLSLARAQVARAELDLGYTTVTTPLKGKVGRGEKDPGSFVDTGANSQLVEVISSDPIKAVFSVSERQLINFWHLVKRSEVIEPGQADYVVKLELIDGSEVAGEGRLTFFDIKVDPKTGTARLEAEVPNPGSLLQPGYFVKVRLIGAERPAAILVPQRAVTMTPTGGMVLVVNEKSEAVPTPVLLEEWQGDLWIVKKGLKAGDRVIVEGLPAVRPRHPVRVESTRTVSLDTGTTPTAATDTQTTPTGK